MSVQQPIDPDEAALTLLPLMGITDYPKNASLSCPAALAPPFTKTRQDAEIMAMRFAFSELLDLLHEKGVLDREEMWERLRNAEWLFQEEPHTLLSVKWMMEGLACSRAKSARPPTVPENDGIGKSTGS